jgi:hypothetical protein
MNESLNTRWLRWSLTGIFLSLVVIALELAVLIGPIESRAMGQIPDSGLQRKQLLETQDRSNFLLESILQHLRTQTLKVKVVGTDKESKTDGATAPAPRVIRK